MTTRYDAIRKAIARALNPKGFNLAGMQRKVVGRDDPIAEHVTSAQWADLVAAFCCAPELGRLMYRLKYAQESPTILILEDGARLLAQAMNAKHPAARPPTRMFLKMARLAFLEWVHDECPKCSGNRAWAHDMACLTCGGVGRVPASGADVAPGAVVAGGPDDRLVMHRICRTCRGSGRVPLDERPAAGASKEACGVCRGTFQRRLTDHQRARQLGMSIETFTGKTWASKYEEALGELAEIDRQVAAIIDRKARRGHILKMQQGAPAAASRKYPTE